MDNSFCGVLISQIRDAGFEMDIVFAIAGNLPPM